MKDVRLQMLLSPVTVMLSLFSFSPVVITGLKKRIRCGLFIANFLGLVAAVMEFSDYPVRYLREE